MNPKDYTTEELLNEYWADRSRESFNDFRMYINHPRFKLGWFPIHLNNALQQFYEDLMAGRRPVLLISTPPQHGKSVGINDFLAWLFGKEPDMQMIFAAFSDRLSTKANKHIQRVMTSDKYKRIFPGSALKPGRSTGVLQPTRNSTTIEIGNGHLGSFFNTTTGGAVTGETLKLGVIDDPVKGREAANSPTIRDKTWDWFESDFFSRFDEYGGLLMIMTRWHVDDLAARIIERIEGTKVINYPAIATEDEQYRNKGMALFPEHKSLKFLNIRKNFMLPAHWEGLYQQRPTSMDGGIILASWWNWYTTLPRLKYRFLTADTAQKVKTTHDYSVFQAWGVDSNKNLFLLDQLRAKLTAPDLRATAEQFYKKHAITKKRADDPSFKGIYIEDKSSGTGLVQELKAIGLRVTEVPRYTDKATRAEDAAITISQGKVFLSKAVQGSDIIVKEASQIPDGANDDCIDATMTAIEHVHGKKTTSLYDLIASGRD